MKKGIIGAGGFGREVYWGLSFIERVNTKFFVDDKYWDGKNNLILPISKFNPNEYEVVIAIGEPRDRFDMVQRLPKETKYFTHIHSTVQILGEDVEIGEGSIVCAGTIITTNVKLGKHAHLNLHTTIGHDCEIGDYFTTAPGAKVSGNCKIFDCVYIGTNASVKEKLSIHSLVTIGSNAAVVKNIEEPGTYVGVPVKKIK
jgi:sugar O-acyltransferase (sialic acid O-acetyltransferase NeuD family)|tara:strand:+ start:288 stop:887 length:600 start_codon:yes stop_codon:yes gene_type:complete